MCREDLGPQSKCANENLVGRRFKGEESLFSYTPSTIDYKCGESWTCYTKLFQEITN